MAGLWRTRQALSWQPDVSEGNAGTCVWMCPWPKMTALLDTWSPDEVTSMENVSLRCVSPTRGSWRVLPLAK